MAKLSLSKAWDESRALLSRDGKLYTTIALASIVLPGVINELVMPDAPPGEIPEPGAWMIVAAVTIIIGIIGQLAMVRLASTNGMTVAEALRHGAGRAAPYVGSVLIWILPFVAVFFLLAGRVTPANPNPLIVLTFFALLLVMLFLFVRLILTAPVASNEAAGPVAILQRSWALTRGNWWRLFGFVLILGIAVFFLMVAVGAVVGVVVGLLLGQPEPMSVGELIIALVTQLATAAIGVVFLVMLARIYAQLTGPDQASVSVPSSGT